VRIAILSALADSIGHADASVGERPAFRRFAGKSVLSHQIDCAAHLGCGRVICLAGAAGPDMAAVRNYAARSSIRFEIADTIPRLLSLVTADDDAVVLADGLLPERAALSEALSGRPGVAAFPAKSAVPLGFERIDADRAWSGALRMRGAGVADLADLPADCDLASSLLRIALQRGERIVNIDEAYLMDGTWQRRVQRSTVADIEKRWLNRQVQPAPFTSPGLALADRVALRWAQDVAGGRWSRAPHLSALATGLGALVAGLASWPLVALALLLLASFALSVCRMFDRIEAVGTPLRRPSRALPAAQALADGLLIGLLAMLIEAAPAWLRIALPLILMAVLRLGAGNSAPSLRALHSDRIALLAVLLLAAVQGWTAAAVVGITLLALGAMLWAGRSGLR
jgi:hypothetical protein